MTALLLLMACSVLAGIPAALLVFATDPRFCGTDDDDTPGETDPYRCGYEAGHRAEMLLRSDATQAQLYAYITGGGTL